MKAVELPVRLSNSKANTWRRCPKAFEFKYVMKLRKKMIDLPLKRGDWLHQLLMTHYDGVRSWKDRHKELTIAFNKLFEEEREEYGDLPGECSRMMRAYLAYYKDEDRLYRVIDTEVDELVDLPNGDKFNFIIDLIVEEEDGGLWLWDHKTVGNFMAADFQLLDAQLARYFWAAKKLGIKNLHGVLFNEIVTKAPTLPKLTPKTKRLEMRANIHCDPYSYMAEIKRHGFDPEDYRKFLLMLKGRLPDWFRRTRLPRDPVMTKRLMEELMWTGDEIRTAQGNGRYPRTVIKGDCEFRCDYTDPCIVQLQGGDISDIVKQRYVISKRKGEDHPGWVGKGK